MMVEYYYDITLSELIEIGTSNTIVEPRPFGLVCCFFGSGMSPMTAIAMNGKVRYLRGGVKYFCDYDVDYLNQIAEGVARLMYPVVFIGIGDLKYLKDYSKVEDTELLKFFEPISNYGDMAVPEITSKLETLDLNKR